MPSFAFLASDTPEAQSALARLTALYDGAPADDADVIVALGGDGFMLQVLHRYMNSGKAIYGMNRGTVGFLMNAYREEGLEARLAVALRSTIHPLRMIASDKTGQDYEALAINEVALFRQSFQIARLRISIDDKVRLDELACDGVMVATATGSTAYNLSAGGPIIPIDAPLLALTPVSPFRPRRWRGAVLHNRQTVEIEVLEPEKRPVNAVADHFEVKSILRIRINEERDSSCAILFDRDHSWDERILAEQFRY
ncbi:inorganic polyphosphate kinase [Aureimonas altamirensis]|uniref:NAD kinase n=1 Tax=Aureimonas altamirensis TaxID=370622 RepID=A0A0B1Q5C1_9HYPH|nr:NAD kinase [Aureimonas altamirensis]KHJ54097.1 inorganic polyphosphate kinase [Aureimonas altamirensis]